jgi:hypothetical protein
MEDKFFHPHYVPVNQIHHTLSLRSTMKCLIFSTCIFLLIFGSNSQRYIAIHSSTKLPTELGGQRAIYDGLNSIYLIGGLQGGIDYQREILRYNILTDTVDQLVGTYLPAFDIGATVQQNRDGDIFILGAGANNDYKFKFHPGTSTIESLGTLPYDIYESGSVKYYDISNSVFIFGGNI